MPTSRPCPRNPAEIQRRVVLSREQRDWIAAAAAPLEQHAGHDEDKLAMLEVSGELRRIAGEWDASSDPEAGVAHLDGHRSRAPR